MNHALRPFKLIMDSVDRQTNIFGNYLLIGIVTVTVISVSRHSATISATPDRSRLLADIALINEEAQQAVYKHTTPAPVASDTALSDQTGSDTPEISDVTPATHTSMHEHNHWHVVLSSHSSSELAAQMAGRIRSAGYPAEYARTEVSGRYYWRVYIEINADKAVAMQAASDIARALGLADYWLSRIQSPDN